MGAVISDQSMRWPRGVVPFQIDDSSFVRGTKERNYIIEAMNRIMASTNVRFTPRSNQADYIFFTKANRSCSSRVGMVGGRQDIGCDLYSGLFGIGAIVHEILHALGFIHEHMRTDRDDWVYIDFMNIKPTWYPDFLKKYGTTNLSEYDYGSIMHYPGRITSDLAVFDTTKLTIRPLKPIPTDVIIGQRGTLSAKDAAAVNKAYPVAAWKLPTPAPTTPKTTPPVVTSPNTGTTTPVPTTGNPLLEPTAPFKVVHIAWILGVIVLAVVAAIQVRKIY